MSKWLLDIELMLENLVPGVKQRDIRLSVVKLILGEGIGYVERSADLFYDRLRLFVSDNRLYL